MGDSAKKENDSILFSTTNESIRFRSIRFIASKKPKQSLKRHARIIMLMKSTNVQRIMIKTCRYNVSQC